MAELQSLHQQDLARAHLDGRWVAQLASKYAGMQVPGQVSPSGDDVFTAGEILAEHQQLRQQFGTPVLLLLSTDYGKRQQIQGHPLWVTFADGGFSSSAAVDQWCAGAFPGLSAADLKDRCAVRRLKPPS